MDFDNREINAVKLERIYDDEEKQTAVWIAPDLGYEIVKIVHHDEDGADYLMELKPESLN